jgi:hypothetical protein
VADDERLRAVVHLIPGAAAALGDILLPPGRAAQDALLLLLQRHARLPEAVDHNRLGPVAVARERPHHGDGLRVRRAEPHARDVLAKVAGAVRPAEGAAVGALVIAQDGGRARRPGEEVQHPFAVRAPVENVADRQDLIAGAETRPVEQVQELPITTVDVSSHQAPGHCARPRPGS